MTQFSNEPQTAAFQYHPEVLANTGQLNSEDFVTSASGISGLHYAESAEDGEALFVSLYTESNEILSFKLLPYEWLVEDGGFKILTDEEFQEISTPAN